MVSPLRPATISSSETRSLGSTKTPCLRHRTVPLRYDQCSARRQRTLCGRQRSVSPRPSGRHRVGADYEVEQPGGTPLSYVGCNERDIQTPIGRPSLGETYCRIREVDSGYRPTGLRQRKRQNALAASKIESSPWLKFARHGQKQFLGSRARVRSVARIEGYSNRRGP